MLLLLLDPFQYGEIIFILTEFLLILVHEISFEKYVRGTFIVIITNFKVTG